MGHLIEPASSGRATCRGCGDRIAAGELRFGESVPYAEGDATYWFHLDCAAYKRPEAFLQALEATSGPIADAERLASEAKLGIAHRRLPRVTGAERSPSGRARCRVCRSTIDTGAWRILLAYYEGGRFQPSGFIHVRCARAYLETIDVMPRLTHFSRQLSDEDVRELQAELEASPC